MNDEISNFIIYDLDDGNTKVDVRIDKDTVWLTMDQIATLYGKSRSTINEHILNIFDENELEKAQVMAKIGNSDFAIKPTNYYNLDMILAVGYRVKSQQGIKFRKWASKILKEYLIKGFALDDEKLKNFGGGNYFKELLDRIRDIRSSEKVLYRQVLELFATSVDYNKNNEECIKYFKIIQNKFHYAVSGKTAAEIVYERADSSKDFMGLKTFTGNMPELKDVTIAKNYLDEKELKKLNNMVSGYFDFAETKAENEELVYMKDYLEFLDNILKAGNEEVLLGNGIISHEKAMEKAKDEYKKYKQKTLSQVEIDYIENLKKLGKVEKDITKKK